MAPFSVFENAGQDCCARSRLLVEASVKDELLEHYVATTRAIVVGDPESDATQVGPLVSAGQRETVEGYVARGVDEGATVLEGGTRPDGDGLEDGFYLRPILDGCTNDMTVAREEIFGPVVSVITFDTEEEAVRIANDTPYGLSGSLWTRDGARQLRVARALRRDRRQLEQLGVPAGAVRRLQGFRGRQGARHGGPRPQHRAQERVHLYGVEPASGSELGASTTASAVSGSLGEPCIALLVALLLLAGAPFAGFPLTRDLGHRRLPLRRHSVPPVSRE